jgi:hypothetical protein
MKRHLQRRIELSVRLASQCHSIEIKTMTIKNNYEAAAMVAESHNALITAAWLREQGATVTELVGALLGFVKFAEECRRDLGELSDEMEALLVAGKAALARARVIP